MLIVALGVAGVWIANRGGPAAPVTLRDPVSVLVANFRNDANEEVFDGLLEQAIAVGIEGAPFLTVYPRRDALRIASQLTNEQTLDEATARLVSTREGIDVIVAGAVARSATDPASRKRLALAASHNLLGRKAAAELMLALGRARDAVSIFSDSLKVADTWLGHFGLGRAYLQVSMFTEAQAEFSICQRRPGEATAVFLDDVPSYFQFPPVHYYLALAQRGMGGPGIAELRTFLDIKRNGDEEGLVTEARRLQK